MSPPSGGESLPIKVFLEKSASLPVADVRTKAEFEKGHIPGAHSLPLFTNDERAAIGTVYKQQGPKPAQRLGLECVGPRLRSLVEAAEKIAPEGKILLHCWRGGMRSGSVAWLLGFSGFQTFTLKGGYKFFRRHVLSEFAKPRVIRILGGLTGTGKTNLLRRLGELGAQTADLEALACHRGSAFGTLGMPAQPTTEQFENNLGLILSAQDPAKPLWLEDESRMVGKVAIPHALWLRMRSAELHLVEKSLEERVENLFKDYGHFPASALAECVLRLERKLGGALTRELAELLQLGEKRKVCEAVLAYYDRTYHFALSRNTGNRIFRVTENELIAKAGNR